MTSQNSIFLSSESDAYTARNAAANAAYDINTDIVARTLAAGAIYASSIIDLGCSTGERLSALCERYGVKALGVGVDASQVAIDIAEARSPDLVWHRCDWTKFATAFRFDLVILSYAMHWIDRSVLMDALKAIHDLTEVGSHVIINDFHSSQDVSYRHADGVMTYKRKYPEMLLATGLYAPICFRTYDYPGTSDRAEPCSVSLMRRCD